MDQPAFFTYCQTMVACWSCTLHYLHLEIRNGVNDHISVPDNTMGTLDEDGTLVGVTGSVSFVYYYFKVLFRDSVTLCRVGNRLSLALLSVASIWSAGTTLNMK